MRCATGQVVLQRLTLPAIDDPELPDMSRLALLRELPFEPGSAVIDFACISRTATATTVIAAAAPDTVLATVRDAAATAGITVRPGQPTSPHRDACNRTAAAPTGIAVRS